MIPRNEYPRPQFVRKNWVNLNGEWEFSFDTDSFDKSILVPYAYQAELSGINVQEFHDIVWYRRKFSLPGEMSGKRILLHFGAVDYICRIYVNGKMVMEHTGGHISFTADITEFIKEGENELKLWVQDCAADMEMARGKQYWEERSSGIFYTRTTGIWQTVWLEAVNSSHLKEVYLTSDLPHMSLDVAYDITSWENTQLMIKIFLEGREITSETVVPVNHMGNVSLKIEADGKNKEELYWSPEQPVLFDIAFTLLKEGTVADEVTSYFGIRSIVIENGTILLNHRPYFQKLLLDQGYWRKSLLTAPTDEDFILDICLTKEMGFNGVRKHQKIEDPRYLYHADRMGLLVWGEIASAQAYSRTYVKRITNEWMEEINRDYNHPCIIVWTPLNESWGVPTIVSESDTQAHSAAMIYIAKSLDRTRLVIGNDGWAHTCSDLITIHDYESDTNILKKHYRDVESALAVRPNDIPIMAQGWSYQGQPILVSEYGGISYQKDEQQGWGYTNASSDEEFALRYYNVTNPLLKAGALQGFCYTQLTDVEQEINGLLTYDRIPKIDTAIIKAINDDKWKPEDK